MRWGDCTCSAAMGAKDCPVHGFDALTHDDAESEAERVERYWIYVCPEHGKRTPVWGRECGRLVGSTKDDDGGRCTLECQRVEVVLLTALTQERQLRESAESRVQELEAQVAELEQAIEWRDKQPSHALDLIEKRDERIRELEGERDQISRDRDDADLHIERLLARIERLREAESHLARLEEEAKRVRDHAIEADGALQPVIGMMRLARSQGEEIDEDYLRRLETAHNHLMRLKDGEDYEAKWAALIPSTPPSNA